MRPIGSAKGHIYVQYIQYSIRYIYTVVMYACPQEVDGLRDGSPEDNTAAAAAIAIAQA